MNISAFLDILEQRRLVSASVVARLREKAAQDYKLTPEAVLKYLVKKDLIERHVAEDLVAKELTVTAAAQSSILGIAPPPTVVSGSEAELELVTDEDDIPTLDPIDSRQNLRLEELDEQVSESSSIFEDSQQTPEFSSGRLSALASFSSKARDESAVEELLNEAKSPPRITKKSKKKTKKERGKSQWDSSIILYGGGGLLVLLLAGAVIYYLLIRENADIVLQQATQYFEEGAYAQAIPQYEKFVTTFTSHPQYSSAKVQLGLAQLWRDTSDTTNYEQALQTANRVLNEIEDEPDFSSAQNDLASLVPKIAKGLATQAETATDVETVGKRVEQSQEALALSLNTKYIPKDFRDPILLAEIEETLARVERNREQSVDLSTTLVAIQEALDKRDIGAAYDLRRDLLERFPALIKDKSLAENVAEISTVEGEVIEFIPTAREAEVGDRPSPILAALTLAEHVSNTPANAEGNVALRVGSSLYGLKADDGSLLWQKYVGSDPRGVSLTLPNGDLLFIDSAQQELVRLKGATGKTVWRLALEGESLQPTISGEQIYVVQPQGRVLLVDIASGAQKGLIKFGQRLASPPVIDESAKRLYLLGEHSSLYTISTEDHSCLGVYYLGQNAGSVKVAPVKILNKLIVALNTGASSGRLIVLATDEKGIPTAKDVSQRLSGNIDTPLLVEGRRLIAVTSSGQISVFEVLNAEGKAALSTVAVRNADNAPTLARFALLHGANIWIGDRQLNRLTIQPTGKSIQLSNIENDFAGDTFNGPLQMMGDVVIHIRRPAQQAGSIVAATNIDSGRTAWQTELGVPLAGAPVVDPVGGRITAVTASGAGYQLDRQALTRRIQEQPDRLAGSRRNLLALTESVSLGQGRIAAGAIDSASILHYRPGAPRGPLEVLKLPGQVTSGLVAWRNGFLAPTEVGQVYFLSGEDGQQLATPFQPPLKANQKIRWLSPAVHDTAEDSQFVLSDGIKRIYLITLAADPQPHLEAVVEADLGATVLNTPLSVSRNLAAAGTDDESLAIFKLPSLESEAVVSVGGRITWGPFPAGPGFLCATSAGELVYVDESGKVAWKVGLEKRQPTGTPLVDGTSIFVAWQLHGVSRVNLADGAVAATTDLEQAIIAGPVPFAARLVLAAADGTLLVINRPE
jgi:tetratricopeptide (TPR) repeat protein